jgi:hypothetical protein
MSTFSNTADIATEQLKDTATHARAAFIDLSTQAMKLFNGLRDAEGRGMDAVLERLGLQRKQSAVNPALWFVAGAVVAGAAVFVLAPTSGKKLRQRIASFLDDEAGHVVSAATSMGQRVGIVTDEPSLKRPPNGAEQAR